MYASENFQSKKALKEAIASAERIIRVVSPGPFPAPTNGETSLEGTWYPQPHKWYARVQIVDGRVTKVIG